MVARPKAMRIEMVRRFNRFYTRQIGVLHEHLLQSPFSLTEVRVLYELANRQRPTATDLVRALKVDPGYLSRMVRNFEKRGLLTRKPSRLDGRQSHLALTSKGRNTFTPLDNASSQEVSVLLARLPENDQHRLLNAMHTIESLLNVDGAPPQVPYLLRSHQSGDMGWVVQRHGELYWKEYSWDENFEALVAEIVAQFIKCHDPEKERCWIAERDGQRIGCVFLVKENDVEAKLRLLLVEPSARKLGVGNRLVEECIHFARKAGYSKMTLWTNSVLEAARHIYQKQGFRVIKTEKHHSFGHDLIGETWELKL
jgi:DNA-binding MarR family transcriptional regulator/N-acetylglutamate synthase-like GNAT family acetyltransferase